MARIQNLIIGKLGIGNLKLYNKHMTNNETRPTQEFVEIDSVQNGVVFLKNSGLRQILIVSGVNFDLKSEDEQRVIVAAYQNMLNSLKFSLQFFVHSRKLNIESYLARFEERKVLENNELLQNQIGEYVEFIKSFVSQNPIMTKAFFVVVPFDPIVIPGAGTAPVKKFFGLFGKSSAVAQNPQEAASIRRDNIDQLARRTSQVVASLGEVGLRAVPLEDNEITELFYNLYNPESRERKVSLGIDAEAKRSVFNKGSLNQQQGMEAEKR